MSTYNPSYCRETFFVILLSLFFQLWPGLAQNPTPPFEKFYRLAQEDTLSLSTKKRLLKLAYESLKYTPTDSIKYSRISKIVVAADNLNDSIFFHRVAKAGLVLAQEMDNPALQGDAHWNYGAYYLSRKKFDSSYSHYNNAYKLFSSGKQSYYAGKMLYNMAYIRSQTNDFTGAEILLFRSIKYFEKARKPKQLYLCYNLLGTNADDMEEYGKALKYYNKAAKYLPRIKNPEYFQLELWNNMGVRGQKLGQYREALSYFDRALTHKEALLTEPALYAKLLDNKAYNYLRSGHLEKVKPLMDQALKLRDSIDDSAGMVVSRLRLASYYAKTGDSLRAINYAQEAFKLADENHFTRDVLQALEVLAELDSNNRNYYLQKHIAVDRMLNARDRNLRNKFTSIQYETEKYIRENERLFNQRLWIIVGSVTLTLLLLLIYLNSRQRSRNKELLFEREQQQYNEDMFLMAMEQKTTLERGRNQERLRISEELHDGILARLFAIRFRWSFLELSGDGENIRQHKKSIALLTNIETEIRNISHDLRNELIWEEVEFKNEIENTVKDRSDVGNFEYTFSYKGDGAWEELDYLYKINICRMLDEILQNVIKHAKASKITVDFIAQNDLFTILVRDNGKGFNQSMAKTGIGLKNLNNRVKKINGVLSIISITGKGTEVGIQFSKKV